MTGEELLSTLSADPMERLRWTVLRAFNVLPCTAEARQMTDDDCMRFAAHMVIDKNRGTVPNPNFSMEKYMSIREAEHER